MSSSAEQDKRGEAEPPGSDEKIRPAVRQRFYETKLQNLKLMAPSPAKAEQRSLAKKDLPPSTNESNVPTSPTLPAPAPSPPVDQSTEVVHATSESNSRVSANGVTTSAAGADQAGKSSNVSADAPPSSHRKRCPKCNAVYDSELLGYCAIDMTPLVDTNLPVVVPARPRPTPPLLLILVGIVLVTAVTATYLITRVDRVDSPSTSSPAQAIDVAAAGPVAGGDLAGKEINLPVPEYPSTIRSEGVGGTITVRVKVNSRGRVISARSSEGDARLRAVAVTAATKATFSVDKLNGRGASGTILYTFKQ